MVSRWNDAETTAFKNDPLSLRAYSSRLLGREPSLVQHGGGNTSVKACETNIFGEKEDVLYVKGSGWDLATIEPAGFAPVRMEILLKLARLPELSDHDMVKEQRSAMTNPSAPNPSVEAILHALIPFKYADHTHSDAVVTLTNTPNGEALTRELLGERILIVPYVMPGFVLARKVFEMTRDLDWKRYDGMVLLNHGVFTFHDDAKRAYENMIALVSKVEDYLTEKKLSLRRSPPKVTPSAVQMSELRRNLSLAKNGPILVRLNASEEAVGFSSLEKAADISSRGTLTPDHVLFLKPKPLVIETFESSDLAVQSFVADYHAYFKSHATPNLTELDPCPRWAIWKGAGCLSIGSTAKNLRIIQDLSFHTLRCLQWGEELGGWKPVSEKDLFAVEYWELEQAKLKISGSKKPALEGKVAVVTGAASGIGLAIANELHALGAAVAALDINASVVSKFTGDGRLGVVCDVRNEASVAEALHQVALHFGGLDILVSNAGTFPAGKSVESLGEQDWQSVLDVNLSGHWRVIKASIPLLKLGFDPSILVIGSKNVGAPGPGAAAYSAAKAGLTQLARVAALELAPFGVRVNTIHPDAVFDTEIWSEEVIANRARHYGLTVEQYKRKNLLKTEITSKDVARLAGIMIGPAFAKTTGAQVPIDGGNDRVI